MALYQDNENQNTYVIPVAMEGRTPEEIARDAVMQIDALMDQIAEERGVTLKNKHAENGGRDQEE